MQLILLNAGGAGLWAIGLFIVFIYTCLVTLIEAGIMSAFRYNVFKKSLKDSISANITSTVIGLILILFYSDLFQLVDWSGYVAFFVVTIIVEGFVLWLRNKQSFLKTMLVCLGMNIVTYPILYLFANIG